MRAATPSGRKFVIADPSVCIGCKTCMAACLMRHDVPGDVAVPRLTLVTTRTISAPVGCHHCAEAPCVDACPTGCLFSDDDHVGVHPEKCIGCRNCVLACPYGAVEIVTEKLPPEPEEDCHPERAQAPACHPERAQAPACHPERSADRRGVEGSRAASAESATASAAGDPSTPAAAPPALRMTEGSALRASAQDDKKVGAAASAQDDKRGSAAAVRDDKSAKGARARARAKKRKRTRSTVVKCDLCTGHSGGPACAKACPTDALRLIDADFMERARQSKRKAAARATASFARMKLNASLDEGE